MCYIPDENGENFNEKLTKFLGFISGKMSGEGLAYIERTGTFIEENHPGKSRLRSFVNEMNREIYLCGIK